MKNKIELVGKIKCPNCKRYYYFLKYGAFEHIKKNKLQYGYLLTCFCKKTTFSMQYIKGRKFVNIDKTKLITEQ